MLKRKVWKFDDFSGPEIDRIKKELAQRLKDLVFMDAERQASEIIESMKGREFYQSDFINAKFCVNLTYYTLLQIVGRDRRKNWTNCRHQKEFKIE